MVLCFVYGCNQNSLRESCKLYRVIRLEHSRARPVYTAAYSCTRPYTQPCLRPVYIRLSTRAVAVCGPCTDRVHGRVRAVYTCTGPVHGGTAVYMWTRPCIQPCSRLLAPVHRTRARSIQITPFYTTNKNRLSPETGIAWRYHILIYLTGPILHPSSRAIRL